MLGMGQQVDELEVGMNRAAEQLLWPGSSTSISTWSPKRSTACFLLCADDIELWPPDAQPLLGRAAVSAQMARGTTRIHSIEITDRRIRGSNEIAYLTASYRTTFSLAENSTPRQVLGSHLWILRKRAGTWVVTLVSWSLWDRARLSPGDL